MKFNYLVIALLLVPCFSVRAEEAVAMTDDACMCECLPMFTPSIEKVKQQCSVQEYAPAHCFKVEKIQKTVDYYKINDHSRSCCTITDENGTRPCKCNECVCPSIEKCCAPRCEHKCAPKCEPKCNKCPKRHCCR